MHLIPRPRKMEIESGAFAFTEKTRIFLCREAGRPEYLAAVQLRRLIEGLCNRRLHLDRTGLLPIGGHAIVLAVEEGSAAPGKAAQGYSLSIGEERVEVRGRSPEGLLHGIRTLHQVVRQSGPSLPAMRMDDEPDIEVRGFYHDVSRGKVPRLDTLKWLVDYLAAHKVNQFQLYVEHPFLFRFDPTIARDPDPLTPDDILELQLHCQDRRIDFVPSLQAFGHLGGLLSHPRYRHLADVEKERDWPEMGWLERMKGATIDTQSPEALALLEKMFDCYIPLFDSPFVNVCADETYDLGKGKNRALAEKAGVGRMYVDHLLWLRELCARHGKRMMVWGDILLKYPDLVAELPGDVVFLNWGYSADHDYDSTAVFTRNGGDFYCCPGVSGWTRVLNDVEEGSLNITRFASAAVKHGARGLLNTDWGDFGHYNLLAGSLHGAALGAAAGWNVKTEAGEFDRSWSALTFNDPEGRGVEALRRQSIARATWVLLHLPFARSLSDERLNPGEEEAWGLVREGIKGRQVFQDYFENRQGEGWITAELAHASKMNVLVGEKILLARELEKSGTVGPNPALAERLEAFAARLEEHYEEYEPLWLARNRPSGLHDIRRVVRALLAEARELAERLRK